MYPFLESPDFEPLHSNLDFQLLKYKLEPSLNTWSSFFLFVVIQAIIVGFILLYTPNVQNNANKLLAILIFFFALSIISYVFYWSGYGRQFQYLNHYPNLMAYITAPLFYLYVRNISKNKLFSKKDLLYFIPAGIAFLAITPYLIKVYFPDFQIRYITAITDYLLHPIIKVSMLVIFGWYSWKLIRDIPRKDQHLGQWLSLLLWCYAGFVLAFATYYVLVNFAFFNPSWDYMISFMQAVFIFIVGFLGYLQPRILQGERIEEVIQPQKYQQIHLDDQDEQHLAYKLSIAMEHDEIFLENDLNLNTLAEYLDSNRHHVSMIINKHFNRNFNDYVNEYRVRRLQKEILKPENDNYTLLYLAIEGGFNNKVSFNKAFKKFTGKTPSQFKQSSHSKKVSS